MNGITKARIVAIDLGSPTGDKIVEAEWRDGKLVAYREQRTEPPKPKKLPKPRKR